MNQYSGDSQIKGVADAPPSYEVYMNYPYWTSGKNKLGFTACVENLNQKTNSYV